MACVEKLLIKGIRSFSPDNQISVNFFKPLTLIVGQNGAGKTTIIECLRMGSCGSLPPNTRSGHSFIHDPKVDNDTEVKAQIRLRLRGSSNQPIVVIRSFQLTQKKTCLQYKAMDQLLQTINQVTGEREAITYKCADIDRIVPTLMGVSKAMLDNVIFVHQEESNWPLGEARTLKDRFDDVFAATKYTKALEAIRKLKTEKTQEVKELRMSLEHLKTHLDNARRLSSQVEESESKSQELESQMKELQGILQELSKRSEIFQKKAAELEYFEKTNLELNTQLKTIKRHNADMFSKLKDGDCEEETGELEEWIRQFNERMESKSQDLLRINREIQETISNLETVKDQHAKSCQHQAKLQAEADAHQKNLTDRDNFLTTAAQTLGVPGPSGSGPHSPAQVMDFQMAVGQKVQGLEAGLGHLKTENRMKDEKMSEEVEKLNAKIHGIVETTRMRRREQERLDTQRANVQLQIGQIVAGEDTLEDLRQKESMALEKLNANKREQESRNFDEEFQSTTGAIENLQRRISALRQERDNVSMASEAETLHKMKRREILSKKEQINHLLTTHDSKIRSVLGPDVGLGELRKKADEAVELIKQAYKKKTDALSQAQNRASQLKGSVDAARQQLDDYQDQLSDAREALKDGLHTALGQQLGEDEYENHLAQHEMNSSKMVEKVSRVKASIKLMSTYVKMADSENECPLCKRGFSENEKETFLQLTSQEIEALPGQVSAFESCLSEVQHRLSGLKELQPVWIRFSDLRDKLIPEQNEKVATMEASLRAVENEAEGLESLCVAARHEVESGQSLLEKVVWPVDRLCKELSEAEKEGEQMERMLSASSAPRSVNEVDKDLDEVDQQKASLERTKDELLQQQNKLKDGFFMLSIQYRDCKDAVEQHLGNVRRKQELDEQVRDIGQQVADLSDQVSTLERERQPLEAQKDHLLEERNRQRVQATEMETKRENEAQVIRNTFDQLRSKMRLIEEYESAGKSRQLEDVCSIVKGQQSQMKDLVKRSRDLEGECKACEEAIRDQEELRREIKDCLDWRRGREEEQKLMTKIDDLNRQMRDVGDLQEIKHELEQISEKQKQHRSKSDMMKGGLATVQDTMKRAMRELQATQYRGIDSKYTNLDEEVKIRTLQNTDLDLYHKAFGKALLTYHNTKMAEINRSIKELWQKTYRGQDIDYIQIRTDTEACARSSYNYRLVMIVGCCELEMRGRCSAGQKVLACIIVRLALAETFCINCGILSLDEPTTNLDKDNAKSLAGALRAIIEARKEQEHFQLIVITHDEEFARMLGTKEYSEKMWRVTKDENHNSMLTLEPCL